MVKISIIVPVYNVEEYIVDLLESVANQDVDKSEYEVIFIDDGSPDRSGEIIQEYARNNSNFIYYRKENGGVSSARNVGLDMAKGEYVWFVDGDDFIKPDCLKHLMQIIDNEKYDIVNFKGYACPESFSIKEYITSNNIEGTKTYWGYATFRIYRSSIIKNNGITFNSNIKYGEDEMFNHDVRNYISSEFTLNETYYIYRQNPNSAMNNLNIYENQVKRLESVILSMVILKEGIENGKYESQFSLDFLSKRYELCQYCFKRLRVGTACSYLKNMRLLHLFDYRNLPISTLPQSYVFQLTYFREHFRIWIKAYYKKMRSKIKSILPEPVVKFIKRVLKMD